MNMYQIGFAAGGLFFRLIAAAFRLVFRFPIALTWLLLGSIALVKPASAVIYILVLTAFLVWAPLRPFSIRGDVARFSRNRLQRRAIAAGNAFLRETSLVPFSDELVYAVRFTHSPDFSSFHVDAPIPGLPSSRILDACKAYADRHDAKSVRPIQGIGGAVEIRFIQRDYLDEPQIIAMPPAYDARESSVQCAVDADGQPYVLSFREVSGMVIAGIPGSGKTAGATSFLLPLALSDDVVLSIIDGKGGTDWSAYAPACGPRYIQGDEDLEVIRDFLALFFEEMNARVATQKQLLGQSNFWNASLEERHAAGLHHNVLVIDECQGLFEKRPGKESADLQGEILRYASQLVKRGRSAGITVIFMTQKPTSEALPTAIRDNCALRIGFRLLTSASETSALGTLPDGLDVPRPTNIPPTRKGGAVIVTDEGDFKAVRFFYMPESEQEIFLMGVSDAAIR